MNSSKIFLIYSMITFLFYQSSFVNFFIHNFISSNVFSYADKGDTKILYLIGMSLIFFFGGFWIDFSSIFRFPFRYNSTKIRKNSGLDSEHPAHSSTEIVRLKHRTSKIFMDELSFQIHSSMLAGYTKVKVIKYGL